MLGKAVCLWVKIVYQTIEAKEEIKEFVSFFGDGVLVGFFG
jgi:hypothetical protein